MEITTHLSEIGVSFKNNTNKKLTRVFTAQR